MQTDRRKDLPKRIVAFRNFSTAPKKTYQFMAYRKNKIVTTRDLISVKTLIKLTTGK